MLDHGTQWLPLGTIAAVKRQRRKCGKNPAMIATGRRRKTLYVGRMCQCTFIERVPMN